MADLALFPGMDGTGILFAPFVTALGERGVAAESMAYPYDEDMTLDALSQLMWSRIEADPPPVILGESYGSQVVLRLLRDHPGVFRAAIFVGGFGDIPKPFLLGLSRWLPVAWTFRIPRPRWVLETWTYDRNTDDRWLDHHIEVTEKVSPEVMAGRVREMATLKPIRREVAVPVLYLQGTHDRLVPARCMTYFEQWCTSLEVARPARSHMIVQTEPEKSADLVAAFLARTLGDTKVP